MKLLVIEDDIELRHQVMDTLIRNGYEVVAVEDFYRVEEFFLQQHPDLVLLDINLPYYDGNYYCRIIRRNSKLPILIMSARNSDMDQILSMELGADDYIVKPFSLQVLLTKVNALIRRSYGEYAAGTTTVGTPTPKQENNALGLTLDERGFKVTYAGATLELSKNEYKLLKLFLSQSGKVIPREELLEELWDDSSFVDDNTLTVNVTRLKQTLGKLGLEHAIKTKRGAGYRFDLLQEKV